MFVRQINEFCLAVPGEQRVLRRDGALHFKQGAIHSRISVCALDAV